jgi:hypothetical protein
MKKYVIINTSEVSGVDFTKVEQTSVNTVRYSLDDSLALVSFYNDTPSFLDGEDQYNNSEILTILATTAWQEEE